MNNYLPFEYAYDESQVRVFEPGESGLEQIQTDPHAIE